MKTLSITAVTHTPGCETQPAFAPDGQHIAYASASAGGETSSIYICALDGTQHRRVTTTPGVSDAAPFYDKNGSLLVFARASLYRHYSMGGMVWDNWDLYTIGVDGSHLHQVTHQKYIRMGNPTISPTGAEIVFDAQKRESDDMSLYKSFRSSSGPTPLTAGKRDGNPAFAPGGSFFVFTSDADSAFNYDVS